MKKLDNGYVFVCENLEEEMNLIETLHNIMEPPSNFQDELISDAFPGDEIKAVAIRGTVLKRGTLYILPIKGTKVFLV